MKTTVSQRTCRRAVLEFLRQVRDRTSLRPSVRILRGPSDIVFTGTTERQLLIEWARPGCDDWGNPISGDEANFWEGDLERTTVSHYERTIQALAVNLEAARVFLELARGRQVRTGPSTDARNL